MPTIRIKNLDEGHLAFDLKDLIDLLGINALKSLWKCNVEEAIAKDLPLDLIPVYNVPKGIDGQTIAKLASITRQVIDGCFEAYDLHSSDPWIRLAAVDSTYWEIWAKNGNHLEPFRKRFSDVKNVDDYLDQNFE